MAPKRDLGLARATHDGGRRLRGGAHVGAGATVCSLVACHSMWRSGSRLRYGVVLIATPPCPGAWHVLDGQRARGGQTGRVRPGREQCIVVSHRVEGVPDPRLSLLARLASAARPAVGAPGGPSREPSRCPGDVRVPRERCVHSILGPGPGRQARPESYAGTHGWARVRAHTL